MLTLTNESGETVTVAEGDIVTMRSGNRYLVVELPTFSWPTGCGVAANGGDNYQDLMLDRIHTVTPGTMMSREVAHLLLGIPPAMGRMPQQIRDAVADADKAARR